jgi:lactate dehydrogenase-like 2-hydroxyacid dehydrogenase
VRWLQLVATGREGLDAHGVPARITVTDVGTTSDAVVAEHAMALLLALARRIGPATLATQGATWARDEVLRGIRSLEGMTLCLAGYGRIGKEIARRAQAFGMQCIAVNRSGHNDAPGLATEVLPLTELHRALARAQAVAISLPASPQTLHLFDRAAWAACPRGALVVNVGRGAVIDTDSLTEALHCGQLAGAGLVCDRPRATAGRPPALVGAGHADHAARRWGGQRAGCAAPGCADPGQPATLRGR